MTNLSLNLQLSDLLKYLLPKHAPVLYSSSQKYHSSFGHCWEAMPQMTKKKIVIKLCYRIPGGKNC